MCKGTNHSIKDGHECNPVHEMQCCCIEKPESELDVDHVKKCISSLRKKADFMESNLPK